MKGKRRLIALLMACLFLSACSRQESSNAPEEPTFSQLESEPSSQSVPASSDLQLEDSQHQQLLTTAEVLTQQIVNHGLDYTKLQEGQELSVDNRGIYRVLISTVDYKENEAYLYHDFFFKKEEDYYLHFPSEKVQQMVYEVFGIEN